MNIAEKTSKILQGNYDNAQSELLRLRLKNDELSEQVIRLFKPEDVQALEKQFEQKVAEKDYKLNELNSKLNYYEEEFLLEFEEKITKIRDLENRNAILDEEIKKSLTQTSEQQFDHKSVDDSQEFFISVVGTLLPDKEFVRGSLNFIWSELPNSAALDVLSKIKTISSLKAERVESAPDWMEHHDNKSVWRIYFRQPKDKKKEYQVLISDKDNQKRDMNWLKHQ